MICAYSLYTWKGFVIKSEVGDALVDQHIGIEVGGVNFGKICEKTWSERTMK